MIVAFEPGLLSQDREPVDRDPGRHNVAAHLSPGQGRNRPFRRLKCRSHAAPRAPANGRTRPQPRRERGRSRSGRSNCARCPAPPQRKRRRSRLSVTAVQSTVTLVLSGSDHSSTRTSIPPRARAIACNSRGSSKARAMPSCCRMYKSGVTLAETSTASTTPRDAPRAGIAASQIMTASTRTSAHGKCRYRR